MGTSEGYSGHNAFIPGGEHSDHRLVILQHRKPQVMSQPDVLSQPFELGFTYTRSTGPVVGRFLTALRERRIVGIRASDGRVIVPPMEYDPQTAAELRDFVEVGQEGEIISWCWVRQPRAAHPLDQPFAWAMIRLDGADVPLIHCVAAAAETDLATGDRVRAVWADQTTGFITDIRCFERIPAVGA